MDTSPQISDGGDAALSPSMAAIQLQSSVSMPAHLLTQSSGLERDDASGDADPATRLTRSSSLVTAGPRKKTVDDFVIGKVLGEGAYGAVVLGTDKETDIQYAIKILEMKHIAKENKKKYVITERDILSKCSHPNVVRLYYTFRSPTSLYYVLELCHNGELFTHLRQCGGFDDEVVRFYTAEIVSVLEYLHSQGIVHRDLKPENILLSSDWHVKITDFGTAKVLGTEKNARTNSFVGTAEYVSPELILTKETCTSSDLWALGSIIYQLFTCRLPFRGKTEFLTFQNIKERVISFPAGFNAHAQDLINELLNPNPDERIGARNGYEELKAHPFFKGIDWENLAKAKPPPLKKLSYTLTWVSETDPPPSPFMRDRSDSKPALISASLRDVDQTMSEATKTWAKFLLPNETIEYTGLVWKRRGLSVKKRQLILTSTPRLIYIDVKQNEQKGEVPLSESLRTELKGSSNFILHTPKRKYILEDPSQHAQRWVDALKRKSIGTPL